MHERFAVIFKECNVGRVSIGPIVVLAGALSDISNFTKVSENGLMLHPQRKKTYAEPTEVRAPPLVRVFRL